MQYRAVQSKLRGSTSRRHLDGNCVALILIISAHTLEHLAKSALAQQVAHSIPAPSTQAGRPSDNDRHTASSCTRHLCSRLVLGASGGRPQASVKSPTLPASPPAIPLGKAAAPCPHSGAAQLRMWERVTCCPKMTQTRPPPPQSSHGWHCPSQNWRRGQRAL